MLAWGRLGIDREIGFACGLTALACAAAYGGLFSHAYPGDTSVYQGYGSALVQHGRFPDHDFYDEYPPGSVPVFALPALVWNAHYLILFKLWMTGCAVGFTGCAGWVCRRLGLGLARLVPVVLAPLALGPVFLNRYDPLAALLVSVALVVALRARDRTTGALLGIGTALKLYPAVLLPIFARRFRSLGRAAVAFLLAGAVLVLPFLAIAPGGVGYSLLTQIRRHLQIESLGASILLAGSKLGIHHVNWIRGKPGSIDLGGAAANVVAAASSVGSLALVVAVAWAYWRAADSDERLVTAAAAAIAAFTIFGKVLSPQYLTWLVPLVPFAAGRRGLWAAGTLLLALALSMPEYLFWGRHGVERQNWTVWLLLFRNALLVAVFWLLYSQLRQGERIAKGP
jgi:hypothetical protein